jgi:hypothetical protein
MQRETHCERHRNRLADRRHRHRPRRRAGRGGICRRPRYRGPDPAPRHADGVTISSIPATGLPTSSMSSLVDTIEMAIRHDARIGRGFDHTLLDRVVADCDQGRHETRGHLRSAVLEQPLRLIEVYDLAPGGTSSLSRSERNRQRIRRLGRSPRPSPSILVGSGRGDSSIRGAACWRGLSYRGSSKNAQDGLSSEFRRIAIISRPQHLESSLGPITETQGHPLAKAQMRAMRDTVAKQLLRLPGVEEAVGPWPYCMGWILAGSDAAATSNE